MERRKSVEGDIGVKCEIIAIAACGFVYITKTSQWFEFCISFTCHSFDTYFLSLLFGPVRSILRIFEISQYLSFIKLFSSYTKAYKYGA